MRRQTVDTLAIEAEIRKAERSTRGEIACVVADEAADYLEVPLIWAAAVALAAPCVPLTFLSIILTGRQLIEGWRTPGWTSEAALVQSMAVLTALQTALFVAAALLLLVPSVRRHLTPAFVKQHYVRQRAFEQFTGKGLTETADRAGVLIYVSLKDRCAELIADQGINAKVGREEWRAVIGKLTTHIRRQEATAGLVEAVASVGAHLARHFPASTINPNEISDHVASIETSTGKRLKRGGDAKPT